MHEISDGIFQRNYNPITASDIFPFVTSSLLPGGLTFRYRHSILNGKA
jgi:hypothetical protein